MDPEELSALQSLVPEVPAGREGLVVPADPVAPEVPADLAAPEVHLLLAARLAPVALDFLLAQLVPVARLTPDLPLAPVARLALAGLLFPGLRCFPADLPVSTLAKAACRADMAGASRPQ